MSSYSSFFYGNLDADSYEVSYILLSRKIKHEFVFSEMDRFLVIETQKRKVELLTIQEIFSYLEGYRYIYDFPEVKKWS